jgi:hypothetical protein
MEEIIMLIDAINRYLQSRPRDERASNCFHPSSLHKSAKALYRHYLEGDNNQRFDSRLYRIFENGHAVQARLESYLNEIGILKQVEVPAENTEYEICGHADGILDIGGLEGVLEIKSMNSNQFYFLDEPRPDHLIQLNVYMFCLGIPRGCLLYECKDDQELKEFYIKQDEKILNPVLEKIRYVQECIRQGKEPE